MSIYDSIVSRQEIRKGWSGDRKYRAETVSGEVFFLRISPMERYERRKGEFRRMQEAAALGIRMCDPIEFGACEEGVYAIQRWIEGRDAEEVLQRMTGEQQYAAGLEAGQILKKLHTLPAPADAEDWAVRYSRKIDGKIAAYEKSPVKYDCGQLFLDYLAQNRSLLHGRPQCRQHGDYHCGNLMFDKQGKITVIDFDRDDWGDPWNEFNRIIWDGRAAPAFAKGMVDGYFDGAVPEEFWRLLALYLSCNMISSLPWSLDYGERELRIALENGQRVLDWFDNMTRLIPSWYDA